MRTLELLLPGLLGPVKDASAVEAMLPALPALSHLLARSDADRVAPMELEEELCRMCGLEDSGAGLPFAALARAGEADGRDPRGAAWLRIDPVHLRIDMTHARLFGAPVLGLVRDEADALVATLNAHFADDGLILEAPAPDRWYAMLDREPALEAATPGSVAGRNVDHFLPGGAEGPYWRRLMNEVQMLLHDHPVNEARESRGALPVNSVWVWGGGSVHRPSTWRVPNRVIADEPIARGLAGLAGSKALDLPGTLADASLANGHNLLVDASIRDPLVHGEAEMWLGSLQAAEPRWLIPALEHLRRGTVDKLILRTGGRRRYTLTRAHLRLRLWRRRHRWTTWLEREP